MPFSKPSPTRFYVQEDVYSRFLKRFTEYANGIKLGDGLEKGITMGPMANARRIEAMEGFVNDAKSRGGKIQTGGKRHGNQGFFYEPTVITDIPDDAKIMKNEPFGPLAPVWILPPRLLASLTKPSIASMRRAFAIGPMVMPFSRPSPSLMPLAYSVKRLRKRE